MFENAVPLDRKALAEHRYVAPSGAAHARDVLVAPLAISEVVAAAREFPLVFPASGRFLPLALMGYGGSGNLHVDDEGQWTARYMPAHLRRYPFVLGETGEKAQYVVMVDSSALIAGGEEGEPLFVGGEVPQGGIVERARAFLTGFQRELEATEAFLAPLKEADVLVARSFNVMRGEARLGRVTDMLVVDQERLAALPDSTLAAWVRSGLMSMVMAHLHSLGNWSDEVLSKGRSAAA